MWDIQQSGGKKEAVVKLASEVHSTLTMSKLVLFVLPGKILSLPVLQPHHRSSFSEPKGSFPAGVSDAPKVPPATSASTMPAVSLPSTEQIPKESLQLFKKDCIDVLNSLPEKKVLIVRFPEAYTKLKHEPFALAKYNAKKIVHLAQAIPDAVKVRTCESALPESVGGVTVSIVAFQAIDPGSTPGQRNFFFFFFLLYLNTPGQYQFVPLFIFSLLFPS